MKSTRAARRRRTMAAVAVVVGLGMSGCATGTPDAGPGAANPDDPCAGGAPVRNELDGPDQVAETPELIAAQDELEALAEESGLVEVRYTATITRAALMAGVDEANALVAASDLPAMGSGAEERNGRWVLSVPAGDDGGAAACTAFRELLADIDIPWAFEVVDAPEESTVREPVEIWEAYTADGSGLHVIVGSCNGDPEVTVLEQTATEVRVEVTSTIPAPGWGGDDCLDELDLTLDAPLGGRTLVDVTTGDAVAVRHT